MISLCVFVGPVSAATSPVVVAQAAETGTLTGTVTGERVERDGYGYCDLVLES
jgi:hypothetical protein